MKTEDHRIYAVEAYKKYESKQLNMEHIRICDLSNSLPVERKNLENVVYILRLNPEIVVESSVSEIPNKNDTNKILYIGGHKKIMGGDRYIQLIKTCRKAEAYFDDKKYAHNDKDHGHPVAGCLTTALLQTGFRIKDCIIDLISDAEYNELEFIIGYQEKYHHLPPWNSNRKGAQGYILKSNV